VDEQRQRFSQIGQRMGFVLADLIDYLPSIAIAFR
jgi:hypothetical protein